MFLYSKFNIFNKFKVINLRRFITLKTVVKKSSFLQASQKLCCTQSTVTFHIQQLKQKFSVQLFKKISQQMCLTRKKKKLLPHIYKLTQVINTLRKAAKKKSNPNKKLRVVSSKTLLSYQMPQVLQRFQQRAPKVRLSLQSLNCYVIRNALLNNKANVSVFYRVKNNNALNQQKLSKQSLVLVASPQIANVNFTKPKKHNACSFIINKPQCVFQQIFKSTLRQQQITVKNTIKLISIKSIKRCVAANIKVSYLPRFAVAKKLKCKKLIKLPFSKQSQTITAMCAHHAKKAVSPAMHTFIQCVKKSFVAK